MLVTTQDTQSLLLYDSDGKPDTNTPSNAIYPGSIVTYGPFNSNGDGVRDVEIDDVNGLIFVAMETLEIVLVYETSNDYKNVFNISCGTDAEPIGLAMNQQLYPNTIFIGDNGYNTIFSIQYEPELKTYQQNWETKTMSDLSHPAGLAVNEKYVYVVAQNHNDILQFEASTGDYIQKFADFDKLDVTGENLLYVQGDGC